MYEGWEETGWYVHDESYLSVSELLAFDWDQTTSAYEYSIGRLTLEEGLQSARRIVSDPQIFDETGEVCLGNLTVSRRLISYREAAEDFLNSLERQIVPLGAPTMSESSSSSTADRPLYKCRARSYQYLLRPLPNDGTIG
jgi:hypothetical protein